MSDDEEKTTGQITDAAKAVAAITENIPVYQDAVQPAAKELGKGLGTVMKAVNVALLPVEGLIWGGDKIKDFVAEKVSKKLENVPPDEIQPPKPHIGVPAVDALRYAGEEADLADLYANLLATAMDRKTAYTAHPGFVDIIKNMAPDEARIMRFLAANIYYPLINIKSVSAADKSFRITHRHISLLGIDSQCEHPPLAANYVDNLERLGLLHVAETVKMSNDEVYKRIKEFPQVKGIIEDLENVEGRTVKVDEFRIEVTDLGKQFIRVCVIDKEKQSRG